LGSIDSAFPLINRGGAAQNRAFFGICADIGEWIQSGIKPADALPIINSRLIAVHLQDRTAFGADGKDPTPWVSQ
jgi:hypothetical protein